jgi:hypothetical protein
MMRRGGVMETGVNAAGIKKKVSIKRTLQKIVSNINYTGTKKNYIIFYL